ncbi:hypothetical protein PRZ48_005760 [Zasmidium cellare]|uniref:BTB domain-containing protein n=1 Tax=Zasmidium cellare TaxID=395010 RepID=A0ABR0EMD6_ZASCE|nr:hypothetical protein PRZ48_005760 [Zasmidium cellare]
MAMYEGESPFAEFFDKEELSDFTVNINGHKFAVHKIVLASQSQSFREKFCSDKLKDPVPDDVHIFVSKLPRTFEFDRQALYGLIGWCYGRVLIGETTFSDLTAGTDKAYFGHHKVEHLRYIADLFVTAKKYKAPLLEKHARDNFPLVMQQYVNASQEDLKDPNLATGVVGNLECIAEGVYKRHRDDAKELRPAVAKAVRSCKERLAHIEEFKKLMVRIPKLCFDVMVPPEELPLSPVPEGRPGKKRRREVESESDLDSE